MNEGLTLLIDNSTQTDNTMLLLPNLGRSPIIFFKHINSDICTRRLNFIGQEEEEMKLCLMILSVPWYMFNGLEHTAILSHFLTFITGSSSRLLRIWFSADLTIYWFPVHENLSISDMDLESKYCYFYHSWDFVPY
jgi:hypothetical protein